MNEYTYSVCSPWKFEEIDSWLKTHIQTGWTVEYKTKRNIGANLFYQTYVITFERKNDYLFFKMVWE